MPFWDLSKLKRPRELYPLTRKPNQSLDKQLLMIARAPPQTLLEAVNVGYMDSPVTEVKAT